MPVAAIGHMLRGAVVSAEGIQLQGEPRSGGEGWRQKAHQAYSPYIPLRVRPVNRALPQSQCKQFDFCWKKRVHFFKKFATRRRSASKIRVSYSVCPGAQDGRRIQSVISPLLTKAFCVA
jgi:hypothetical protein